MLTTKISLYKLKNVVTNSFFLISVAHLVIEGTSAIVYKFYLSFLLVKLILMLLKMRNNIIGVISILI